MSTNAGPAVEDVYGKLYFHIKDCLFAFHERVRELKTTISLHRLDANQLPRALQAGERFDRIEVRLTQHPSILNVADITRLQISVSSKARI